MEEGSMRCDVNVSIMPKGSHQFGKRVEIKNLNSIRNVQRSIDFEICRHASLLEEKKKVEVETRTYDVPSGETIAMRKKKQLTITVIFQSLILTPLKSPKINYPKFRMKCLLFRMTCTINSQLNLTSHLMIH